MIVVIWSLGCFIMAPVAVTVRHEWLPIAQVFKCAESWDNVDLMLVYTVLLLVLLLIGPLIVMIAGYTSIAFRLYFRTHEQGGFHHLCGCQARIQLFRQGVQSWIFTEK